MKKTKMIVFDYGQTLVNEVGLATIHLFPVEVPNYMFTKYLHESTKNSSSNARLQGGRLSTTALKVANPYY